MKLCFFEDKKRANFHPLTLSRPLDDLRLGIFTIRRKWMHALKADSFVRTLRPSLQGVFESGNIDPDQSYLWINARYLPSEALLQEVRNLNNGTCLQVNETVIAAKTDSETSRHWLDEGAPNFSNLLVVRSQPFDCIEHLWDLFRINGEEITRDVKRAGFPTAQNPSIAEQASQVNRDNIILREGAEIEAGCVLDARGGPIYIGENATVMAGSILLGPVAVCKGGIVKAGAKIYGDTTIGPICKVGGEVSNTIFHSYSNKAHHGYIGNSVVGQWCNFGAGTTISNLKTNYSNIRVPNWQTGEEQDSQQQFVGVIFGDHSKTAINGVINSGTVAGVCCNILSRDFPPKLIRSFSWVGSNVIQPYKVDKALETMKLMMARRNVTLSEPYERMMRHIFKESR